MTKTRHTSIIVAVVGSRALKGDWPYAFLVGVLGPLIIEPGIKKMVSGGALGADSLARRFAKETRLPLFEIHPEWNRLGKKAGIVRNLDIVKSAQRVVALWDGVSPGTKAALDMARRLGKRTTVVMLVPHGEPQVVEIEGKCHECWAEFHHRFTSKHSSCPRHAQTDLLTERSHAHGE